MCSLTVWLNGERRGVMVQPGMKDRYGQPIAPLVGPLRWALDLTNASVRIDGPKPPPATTAADLAEDARKQREFDARSDSDTDDE